MKKIIFLILCGCFTLVCFCSVFIASMEICSIPGANIVGFKIAKLIQLCDKERELASIEFFTDINQATKQKIQKVLKGAIINNIFRYGDIKYIDYISKENRLMLELHPDGKAYKYIQIIDKENNLSAYVNMDNKKISSVVFTDNFCNLLSTDIPILDPIMISNQYIPPYTSEETYQGLVEKNGNDRMSLHETFDDFVIINGTYRKYPLGTSIAALSLQLRVSLDAVCKWIENSKIKVSPDNMLLEDVQICMSKTLQFRYGREIYLLQNSKRKCIYDIWASGKIQYTLANKGRLYDQHNCVEYRIVDIPTPMTLCNEYYWNLGIKLLRRSEGGE